MGSDSKEHPSPLASGMPPWHSILLFGLLLALGVFTLPSNLDEYATIENFTHREFPEYLSLRAMAYTRLVIFLLSWTITVYVATATGGWHAGTTYKPVSKLRQTTIHLSGFKTLCPFTSWCWMLQGTNYLLTGYIALMVDAKQEHQIQDWMLKAALITWELSAPFSLLVSAIVRYSIWPAVLRRGVEHKLGSFRNQMQHNMNSVMTLTELCLLGGLPLEFSHTGMHLVFGCTYILFSWLNCYNLSSRHLGPQYLYWFLDTTLGVGATIALAVLVTVLVCSSFLLLSLKAGVDAMGQHLIGRILCVTLVSSAVIRTK